MREDVFSLGCDFQFGGAQAVHDVRWTGGRGLLCVTSNVIFSGGAGINVAALASDESAGTVNVGFPAGITGNIVTPGNYVFDAPAGVLRFSVNLAGGGDRLQVGDSIFVEKM